MEFQDVVRRRRMIRNYADTPVDPGVVDRAIRNATHAPSAGFSQGWGSSCSTPRGRPPLVGGHHRPRRARGPRRLADRHDARAGRDRPCSSKAYLRYAEPDKGWTDEDEARWPMPFWHMDAAMASLLILQTAVDEGWVLLRHPAGPRAGGTPGVRHPRHVRPRGRHHDRAPGRRRRQRRLPAPGGNGARSTTYSIAAPGAGRADTPTVQRRHRRSTTARSRGLGSETFPQRDAAPARPRRFPVAPAPVPAASRPCP